MPSQIDVAWKPQPGPQCRLIQCVADDIFFGGERGGGKTDGLLGDFAAHWERHGSGVSGLIIRRTHPQLEHIIKRTNEIYPALDAVYRGSGSSGHSQWTFPGGATLKMRHLDRDADADNYQGHEYTWIGVDEAGTFPSPSPIDKLRGTLRSSSGIPTRLILTGNPGGPGHMWLKKRYIDPMPRNKIYDVYVSHSPERVETIVKHGAKCDTGTYVGMRCFIPSSLKNNPALAMSDPDYESRLRAVGNRALVRAWLEGDWSIDVDGALWKWDDIENNRVSAYPELIQTVIALDPAATAKGHETGIAIAGLAVDGHKYLLHSEGLNLTPDAWARRTVQLFDEYGCDLIYAEKNQGGEMVRAVLDKVRKGLPIYDIHAKKGKALRAEPVAIEYEQGKIHHVGRFQELEEQMTTFPISHLADDRLDAAVYAMLALQRGARTGPIPANVEW